MKSVPKLIRRFVSILLLSAILILTINLAALTLFVLKLSPSTATSPYNIATEIGAALKILDNKYILPKEMTDKLELYDTWAILIDNDALQVVWKTENLPPSIPSTYTLSEIANIAIGYVDDYPTYIGKNENGIVVLGFPKDSFWKHTRASWNYNLIANLPQTILTLLLLNTALILMIYIVVNTRLLKSIKPIIRGIQSLSTKKPIHISEKGVLSEISANINQASDILEQQQNLLNKKETARANWIAGVSHDIRTPLSVIMGYAEQLKFSNNLSEAEQKKADVIVKQSERMKNLISNLNLASKLEYNMQPLMKKPENAVALVRQIVVDFINMDIDDKFPIKWKTSEELLDCTIDADKELLKRALANLIQNSINHNETGCIVYISIYADDNNCIICLEDNGIGVTDEQINKLSNAPHYIVCDTNPTEQRHGLGLLIVKQIVSGHNGKFLIAHSDYGGFKVVLTFPKYKPTPKI